MSQVLRQLADAGQSVWLDFVSRSFLQEDRLADLIASDGVSGLTSNPATFERAIIHGNDYDQSLRDILADDPLDPAALYERLATQDIRTAADVLRPLYDSSGGRDGYVSLEVAPILAFDVDGTLREARRLLRAIGRPNLMIKVPGTEACAEIVRSLVAEGCNVNITLLFSVRAYRTMAEAYMEGLEQRVQAGKPLNHIASVASFFLSRIDSAADRWIDQRVTALKQPDMAAGSAAEIERLQELRGRLGIASARLAYQAYQSITSSERWKKLEQQGARSQRLLWASTGVKDSSYSQTKYVDSLIGPDTVCSMPPATLEAARVQRNAGVPLLSDAGQAAACIEQAGQLGLPFNQMMTSLISEGVRKFEVAYANLLNTLAVRRAAILGERQNAIHFSVPGQFDQIIGQTLQDVEHERMIARLWSSDVVPFVGARSSGNFGWLAAAAGSRIDLLGLERFAAAITADRIQQIVVLGVGGASLGAEALASTLGPASSSTVRELIVLDSTDPDEIRDVQERLRLSETLFIVASKSGTTLETNLLHSYFYELVLRQFGPEHAGQHFAAIAPAGSDMEKLAQARRFRAIFEADPQIGGAYSVLSSFGIVPLAALGHDIVGFFDAAAPMVAACAERVPTAGNPAGRLGVALAEASRQGHNKLTIVLSAKLSGFGPWLAHLLSVSIGKAGHGLVPVLDEPIMPPAHYEHDRLFIHLRLDGEDSASQSRLSALSDAGHPVVTIHLAKMLQIGQEFFRWQVAAALASSILRLDPFEQPDIPGGVRRVSEWMAAGSLPRHVLPSLGNPGAGASRPILQFYGDAMTVSQVEQAARQTADSSQSPVSQATIWRAFWDTLHDDAFDYAGILAYVPRQPRYQTPILQLCQAVRERFRVPAVRTFGPRYLHSIGQVFKGGPATGIFLVLTASHTADLEVAGSLLSLGQVQYLQAMADVEQLTSRGRRCLHVHIDGDIEQGLKKLIELFALPAL